MTPLAARSEKAIQADAEQLCRMAGCTVFHMSQARATKQTAGIADAFVTAPTVGTACWYECKKPGGVQSPAQREFQSACERSGVTYVLGGIDAMEAWLIQIGLARRDGGQLVLTPKRRTP